MKGRLWPIAAWIGVPFLLYLLLLRHFWFNAPAWDDIDAILNSLLVLEDAKSGREWLGLLLNQHNEHRIAFARLVAWVAANLFGQIDFRGLVFIANLAWPGILLVMGAELRDRVEPWVFGAAAFLMLQLSHYEASLLSMAALSNVGAVFFAFVCLFFAGRAGAAAAAACVAFGVLAAGSQASGLFAMPIAAVAAMLAGRRLRAAVLVAVAIAVWAFYFTGYVRPPQHPALVAGLVHPIASLHLFAIIVGGVLPGRWLPIPVAVATLGALAWSLRRGLWKVSPTTVAWAAFILVSAGATTLGRVGFGVFHSSRYAIYSSCLLAIAVVAIAAVSPSWPRARARAAVVACAAASFAITAASWWWASEYSFRGRLLEKGMPVSADVRADEYFGLLYPNREWAERILVESQKRGRWRAPTQQVFPTTVRLVSEPTPATMRAGHVDEVVREGNRVRVTGWAYIPATVPGRTLVLAGAGRPGRTSVRILDRVDVATRTRIAGLVFSGFVLELDYATGEEAGKAAGSLCLLSEGPKHEIRLLEGSPGCPAGARPAGLQTGGKVLNIL